RGESGHDRSLAPRPSARAHDGRDRARVRGAVRHMMRVDSDADRLRAFWDSRYQDFSLSESGWLGAGARLNEYLYPCQFAALRSALRAGGLSPTSRFSVLDAGCGQGHFARFYRHAYASATYVGVDISERVVAHLRRTIPGGEFHAVDLAAWRD